ncbi:MAG: GAF domain-containing protein [Anaerolineae bacterium]|jgi:GAF domain-containing protein
MEQAEHPSDAKLNALYRLGQQLILLRDERTIADTVLEIAEEVLDFGDSEFLVADDVNHELYVIAHRGALHVARDLHLPLDGEKGITVAAARRGEPVYVPEVEDEPLYVNAGFAAGSELAVPVQTEGRVLGVINVESLRTNAYTSADARLLSTLASQAALALQNARHHSQERRRSEQMAVINRNARRITATLDLRDTLDAIVEAAADLVPCVLAEISLWDEERQMLTLEALRCEPERAFPIGRSYPPGGGYTGWLVRHKQPLLVQDVDAREDIRPDLLSGELPFKAYLGVPLIAGDELIGTLVLIRDRADSFDDDHMSLLESLAAQAAAAIRNARLYEELARRHRETSALYSVAETANRPLDLEELLEQALDRVVDVTDADAGAIRLIDPTTREVTLAAHHGLSHRFIQRTAHFRLSDEIVGAVARSGQPALSEDMQTDPRISREIQALVKEEGYRSLAQVPLRTQDEVVGTLGVVAEESDFFDEDDLRLLDAIGQQLGIAIASARLRQEALQAERLAAVGKVAASVAHELRSPLGGIMRSAEFLARTELSHATRQRLSQAIVAMARRLLSTAKEILDFTQGGRLALRRVPCDLPTFLDQILEVLRVDFSDRGIEVITEWDYTGHVRMDPDRMSQVVYNIAANARDAMPSGGQLSIRSRRVADRVELRFADTGPGVPPELAQRIFEPFVSYGKREGAGLGLAIAQRIVREHGGDIQLESPGNGGATFVVTLPLE